MTKQAKKQRIPKVRIARPKNRPFQLRYTCPDDGREVRISTGTRDEDDAEQQKLDLEAKLRLGIDAKPEARKQFGPDMDWQHFREEYRRLKLSTFRSTEAQEAAEIRLDICESVVTPKTLAHMAKPETLARLQSGLLVGDGSQVGKKRRPRSPHTVRSYLGALTAALNWAHKMKWLPERVTFEKLEADEPDKGRPITTEEFERMLAAVPKVCPVGVAEWRFYLRGLWESGLRLGESLRLSWDIDGTIQPVFPARGLPYLVIPAKMQKNRKAQEVPLSPAFAKLLAEVPEDQRTGWIFNPPKQRGEGRMSEDQVGRTIGALGKKANIVVSQTGKPASAHDLRRSFGQRMADAGVPVRLLQKMMRHASFATTEQFYLRDRVQDQARQLAMYLGTDGSDANNASQDESTQARTS